MAQQHAFRWGIIATGGISAKFAQALRVSKQAELAAVGSRDAARAQQFAAKYHAKQAYGSYRQLIQDKQVEIVYIGATHNCHYQVMLEALNAGKHVLCEKPMTMTESEAAECIEIATKKRLFLMEAVWMRFIPAIRQLVQWVQSGVIGTIKLIQADFCINRPYDPKHRLFDPALGGSALLDLGIYPVSLTTMLLGHPYRVESSAVIAPSGVDESNGLLFRYQNGAQAVLYSGSRLEKPMSALITGTQGRISIPSDFICPQVVQLETNAGKREKKRLPYSLNGYPHEIDEVHDCLAKGKIQSDIMPLSETAATMKLFDELRARWGVRYAQDNW